jgi:hypothetical protein
VSTEKFTLDQEHVYEHDHEHRHGHDTGTDTNVKSMDTNTFKDKDKDMDMDVDTDYVQIRVLCVRACPFLMIQERQETLHLTYKSLYIFVYLPQFLTDIFPLQVMNKRHDGVVKTSVSS